MSLVLSFGVSVYWLGSPSISNNLHSQCCISELKSIFFFLAAFVFSRVSNLLLSSFSYSQVCLVHWLVLVFWFQGVPSSGSNAFLLLFQQKVSQIYFFPLFHAKRYVRSDIISWNLTLYEPILRVCAFTYWRIMKIPAFHYLLSLCFRYKHHLLMKSNCQSNPSLSWNGNQKN